jgi:hypothetical protein
MNYLRFNRCSLTIFISLFLIATGCTHDDCEIFRENPEAGTLYNRPLYLEMMWITTYKGKPNLCVRYATSDIPPNEKIVEFDRYALPGCRLLEKKSWASAIAIGKPEIAEAVAVYRVGGLYRAEGTSGPLSIVRNWYAGGITLGLCCIHGFAELRHFGPWDRTVYLDGTTAILELPNLGRRYSTNALSYQYIHIDSSGNEANVVVPDGTQELHSNGKWNIALGPWGAKAADDAGKEAWSDSSLSAKNFEDDSVCQRDFFVIQRDDGFEVRKFATNQVSFVSRGCSVQQVAASRNVVVITGYDIGSMSPSTLWVIQDGSLVAKIPSAGCLPNILRSGDHPVVSADSDVFSSPLWHRQGHKFPGLPCLLSGGWLIRDDGIKQRLTIERFPEEFGDQQEK